MIELLIADDEVWVARMIATLIDWEAEGFHIAAVCHDGVEAMEQIRACKPQLVLTDIKMPGMTGLEMIKTASAEGIATRFVIISGYNDFEYARTAITFGASAYLLKPIDRQELLSTVTHVREQIADQLKTEQDHSQIVDTLDRTIERSRRQYFLNQFEHPTADSLEEINASLSLRLHPGTFRVAVILAGSELKAALVRDQLTERLPVHERVECYTFANDCDCYLILNDEPGREKETLVLLGALLREVSVATHLPLLMGIGSVETTHACLSAAYGSAQVALSFRWLQQGPTFENSARSADRSEIAAICSLGMELKIRAALKEGNRVAVAQSIDEILNQARLCGQRSPCIPALCVRWLLALFSDAADLANAVAKQAYLRQCEKELRFCEELRCVGESLLALVDALFTTAPDESRADKNRLYIEDVLRYIDQNYIQDISLNDAAEVAHLNPNYFCTLFKEETGVNFKEYLLTKRVEAARRFLKSEKYKFSEIAGIVGFNDPKHFTRVFKKITGVTPGEYRRIMLGHE